ncbi:MAG TPA: FAD-dependent oxidoreductase, partial [Acidimicrobiales bacterium]|nr:FAD-dependent oxidoreductase [Acidimicrobiales bacterium]
MAGQAVIVVGSGAAGLAAALAASAAGAEVLVVERAHSLGGTTAISGGVVWAPGNHLLDSMRRWGDVDDTVAYLKSIASGDSDHDLMTAFASDAARVVSCLEERTSLTWSPLEDWPDYHEGIGSSGGGRSIWPEAQVFKSGVAALVQETPESAADDPGGARPSSDGVVFRGPVRGRVLVGALVEALIDSGVELRTGTRASRLCGRDGDVSGVVVDGEVISGRVVLATGGFQHDAGLLASFLGAVPIAPMGTPGCAGDGLRMAMSAGAGLGNMSEGWWMPAMH